MPRIGSTPPPSPSSYSQGSGNSRSNSSNANAVAPSSTASQGLVPSDGGDFFTIVSDDSLQPSQSGVYTQEHGYSPSYTYSNIVESIDVWSREVVINENRHGAAQKIREALHDNKLDLSGSQITTLPRALPSNIKVLNVSGCASLTKIEPSILNNLETLNIKGCTALTDTRFPDGLEVIRQ